MNARKKSDASAAKEAMSDERLFEALGPLAPRSHEQRDAEAMLLSFRQSMIAQGKQQEQTSFSFQRIGVVVTLLLFMVLPLLGKEAFFTRDTRAPQSQIKGQRAIPPGGDITPKGAALKKPVLQILSKNSSPWRVVLSGVELARYNKLSMRFRLQDKGGFATILWIRAGHEFSVLYESPKQRLPGKWHTCRKQDRLLQFPLTHETTGHITLVLIQSSTPLNKRKMEHLRKQILAKHTMTLALKVLDEAFGVMASRPFSFQITENAKSIKP